MSAVNEFQIAGRPTCSQSVHEPGANAAAGGVAEMVIVWRSAERHAPQCSALAAASESSRDSIRLHASVSASSVVRRWRMCRMAWT